MKSLLVTAGALLACIALVAGGTAAQAGGKKTDAEKLAELKEKVKAKYVEDKGGALFNDWVYWVDIAGTKETRWTNNKFKDVKPEAVQKLVFASSWAPSIDATPGQSIQLVVETFRHKQQLANGKYQPNGIVYNNTGENVPASNVKGLCDGQRKDWVAAAKDVDKKLNKEVKKTKSAGPAGVLATATATDSKSDQRMRKEWLGWIHGKRGESYVVSVTYGADLIGDAKRLKSAQGRVYKLLKNVKIIDEMK